VGADRSPCRCGLGPGVGSRCLTGDPASESAPPMAAFSSPSLSSTTGTNTANSDVPITMCIGEDTASLDPAAPEPGSISAAVNLYVYERMQQTVDGVIL
jgi:hypothetical protein